MFKSKTRKRLIWSSVAAIIALTLMILLGPSRDVIKKRFEFSGAEGPLQIMPELSIEEGDADRHQDPKFFRDNPPPPNIEVIPEETTPEAPEEVPRIRENVELESDTYADAISDPDLDIVDQVEMNLPQQTNPWFVLIRMVRPQYPSSATEAERRTPIIVVEVAFFVSEEGNVTASYILNSTGSRAFNEVVLKAVDQWLYKPVWYDGRPPRGFWNRLTIRFKSPYRSSS